MKLWVVGKVADVMRKLSRSLSRVSIATPIKREGNRQGTAEGVPAGGVAWPVQPDTHDGLAFIYSPCFLAYYDAKKKEAYCLDEWKRDKRHKGADPLKLGNNLTTSEPKRSGLGVVYRTAEYGTEGLDKNVFAHADGAIIAHHLPEDQPDNSTPVHDPDGESDRAGGLHYAMRVRRMVTAWCGGKTTVAGEPLYAPMLNMTKNGDGTVADGIAHFESAEAVLSHEAHGPLRPSSKKHEIGYGEASIRQGAIDLYRAIYSDGTDANSGPKEFIAQQWQSGAKGPYIRRVEMRPDRNDIHKGLCGNKPTVIKWMTWENWGVYEPPGKPPESPPPGEPPTGPPIDYNPDGTPTPEIDLDKPPGSPGGPDKIAYLTVPEDERYPPTGDPAVSTPYETERPSSYGRPRPNMPDQPEGTTTAPPEDFEGSQGFTERAWLEQPRTSHEVDAPVYVAGSDGDWVPQVKKQPLIIEADGQITAHIATTGDGSKMFAGADMRGWHTFQENKEQWPTDPTCFTAIIHAGKNDADVEVAGRFGLGQRLTSSCRIASGAEFSLDYTGTGGKDTPDLHIWTKDETAANDTDGKLYFNGVEITGGGQMPVEEKTDNFPTSLGVSYYLTGGESKTATLGGLTVADIGKIVEFVNRSGFTWTVDAGANTVEGSATGSILDGQTWRLRIMSTTEWRLI